MTDDDRAKLYATLLSGLANEAQDRLCAADKQHVWGRWEEFRIKHDLSDVPLRLDPSAGALACSETFRVGRSRRCQNCGKEQSV